MINLFFDNNQLAFCNHFFKSVKNKDKEFQEFVQKLS